MANLKNKTFPEPLPEILHTRRFFNAFTKCISDRPSVVDIVVPYIGESRLGGIVRFAEILLKRECQFNLTTARPSTAPNRISAAEAQRLVRLGVELRIHGNRPMLHSKIYQFTYPVKDPALDDVVRVAFVGSANFSRGGLETNVETMACFRGPKSNGRVAATIASIASGSYPYNLHQHEETDD